MRRDLPPGGPVRDPDREVRAEIDFYLEERARELEEEGMSPEEARREARRRFGDVEKISAEVRRIRRRRERWEGTRTMIDTVTQDVRMALRGLARRPGFGAVAVGTLALGIGAVTAIFGVAEATLLQALPFEDADRLVFVQGAYDAPEGPSVRGASIPEARDWAESARSFEALAPVDGIAVALTGVGTAERVVGEQVGPGFWELFRLQPAAGRFFGDAEARPPGASQSVVLGHGLWQRSFGGDPAAVGRTVDLNGRTMTVVGVAPEGFGGVTLDAELWIPMGNDVTGPSEDRVTSRGTRWLTVVGRLAEGVGVEEARAEMAGIARALEERHPDAHEDRIALVTPAREVYLGSTRTLVLVVLGATGLLLLIAAANVANLLLVRASARSSEVLMRRALGAGRGRLVAQFLTEGLVLAALGAGLGLLVGIPGARLLAAAMPDALLPSWAEVRPDLATFGVAAGLMAAVGVLAGLAPALFAARRDVGTGVREGRESGRVGGRSGLGRLQGALVVGEVALALVLLVGAGLMARSFGSQLAVRPGFDHEELYAFRLQLPAESYDGDGVRAGLQELEERLEADPALGDVTFGSDAPLRDGYSASYLFLEGASEEDRIRFYVHRVRPDWFETVGTRIVRGRALGPQDLSNPDVTVVSRSLAERFFPDRDPVGRSLNLFEPEGPRVEIVGVAEDVRWRDLTSDLTAGADDPDIYVLWDSIPSRGVSMAVRTTADPGDAEPAVRRVVEGFDPDLPVQRPGPMADALAAETAQARFGSTLLAVFSALAGVLALVGLYGVLAFAVDGRRREIAVRMALGAEAGRVRRMVVVQGMRLVAAGLALGLAGAWVATRSLEAFLFDVERADPVTWAGVTALLALVALAAVWLPALRATRIDPGRTLGGE